MQEDLDDVQGVFIDVFLSILFGTAGRR